MEASYGPMNIPRPSDWTSQLAPLDRDSNHYLSQPRHGFSRSCHEVRCVRGPRGGAACQASTALGGERWRSGNGFGGRNWAIDVVSFVHYKYTRRRGLERIKPELAEIITVIPDAQFSISLRIQFIHLQLYSTNV